LGVYGLAHYLTGWTSFEEFPLGGLWWCLWRSPVVPGFAGNALLFLAAFAPHVLPSLGAADV